MEISKLLNVLTDILNEEENYDFQNKIVSLKNSIQNSQEKEIENLKQELFEDLKHSIINQFVKSDLKILEEIKGTIFWGNFCKIKLDEIINKPYGREENFVKFIDDRNQFIEKNRILKKTLEQNDFKCHFHSEESEYELGFLIPNQITDLEQIKKEIDFLDKFLKDIKEISNEERTNKITLLNNGSWEIFIGIGSGVLLILTIIEKILAVIKQIEDIGRIRQEKVILNNKKILTELDRQEKEIWNESIEEISKKVIKEFNGKEERKNELENSICINLKKLLIKFKEGFFIEIKKPRLEKPRLEQPRETTEEERGKIEKKHEEALKKYNEKIKEFKNIDDINLNSNTLNFEEVITSLPFNVSNEEEN